MATISIEAGHVEVQKDNDRNARNLWCAFDLSPSQHPLKKTLVTWHAKVSRYWVFAGLGAKMPANVRLGYQKVGL